VADPRQWRLLHSNSSLDRSSTNHIASASAFVRRWTIATAPAEERTGSFIESTRAVNASPLLGLLTGRVPSLRILSGEPVLPAVLPCSPMAQREKRSISLSPVLAAEIDRAAAAEGTTVSAWIAATAEHRLRLDAGRRGIAEWERENGALTVEELADGLTRARAILGRSGSKRKAS
jgi:hypothetical protein